MNNFEHNQYIARINMNSEEVRKNALRISHKEAQEATAKVTFLKALAAWVEANPIRPETSYKANKLEWINKARRQQIASLSIQNHILKAVKSTGGQ
jgi:hypothetical protein